jgi:hypothetical protein
MSSFLERMTRPVLTLSPAGDDRVLACGLTQSECRALVAAAKDRNEIKFPPPPRPRAAPVSNTPEKKRAYMRLYAREHRSEWRGYHRDYMQRWRAAKQAPAAPVTDH